MNPIAICLAGVFARPPRSNLIQPDPTSIGGGWIALLPLENYPTDPTDPTFFYIEDIGINADSKGVDRMRVYARVQYREKPGSVGSVGSVGAKTSLLPRVERAIQPPSAIQPLLEEKAYAGCECG